MNAINNPGPDSKHPNWEPDLADEAYTLLREGAFKNWEDLARFLFKTNKELRAKISST